MSSPGKRGGILSVRVSVSVSGGDCRFDSPSPRPFEHPVSANLRQRLATSAGRTWTAVLGVRRLNSRILVLHHGRTLRVGCALESPADIAQLGLLFMIPPSSRAYYLHRFNMGADHSPDWSRFLSHYLDRPPPSDWAGGRSVPARFFPMSRTPRQFTGWVVKSPSGSRSIDESRAVGFILDSRDRWSWSHASTHRFLSITEAAWILPALYTGRMFIDCIQ